jgi:membrane protein implicated in regulation of membrane protease activity
MDPWIWWLIFAVILVGVELTTGTLVLIMIAAGALAAAGAAGLGGGVLAQLVAFGAVSALMMGVVRPVAKRHMETPRELRMGVAALVGSEAAVVEEVGPDRGRVRIGSDVWTARPFDGDSVYSPGDRVYVLEIQGATALVG